MIVNIDTTGDDISLPTHDGSDDMTSVNAAGLILVPGRRDLECTVMEMSDRVGWVDLHQTSRLPGRFHLRIECLEAELFCCVLALDRTLCRLDFIKVRIVSADEPRDLSISRRVGDLWDETPGAWPRSQRTQQSAAPTASRSGSSVSQRGRIISDVATGPQSDGVVWSRPSPRARPVVRRYRA